MSNKDRLYIALYARGNHQQKPGTYHWAFIVGEKQETANSEGKRYHAKQKFDGTRPSQSLWVYEDLGIPLAPTMQLLTRIAVAKVLNRTQLERTIAGGQLVQDDPSWTCRIWVREALANLEADGKSIGTHVSGWDKIEGFCKQYTDKKVASGRFRSEYTGAKSKAPTFDMMEGRELFP